ncbi:uncharacterized protein DUF1266 [Leucobacter luti]|uniref:DUF1266 domain-containing protein n=1 Tax=Leucobacter luti TaxID=340320 RepID=UPI001047E688|nr:DUF1266 domain-containing protein [Leucobacter luti]MCW2289062.1 hypothetical protein [Leucobacter luti]TCK35537.1 uncharacterized protein DUF1266 [Leucobacter luti]
MLNTPFPSDDCVHHTHTDFPVGTRDANLLALGLQQLSRSAQPWNDPTAAAMSEEQATAIREWWGFHSRADLAQVVTWLSTQRRRREHWQQLLALRDRAALANGGQRPCTAEWLSLIAQSGGTGLGDELDFVRSVTYFERSFGHADSTLYPAQATVTSFDGYALGQAAAIPIWGVGLGLISPDEALELVEQVNEIARTEFGSWQQFGRSYALGRAMHWSDGAAAAHHVHFAAEAVSSMESALDPARGGPWATLPWWV